MNLLEYLNTPPRDRRIATRTHIQQICGAHLPEKEINELEVLLEQDCPRCDAPQLMFGYWIRHCNGRRLLGWHLCFQSWWKPVLRNNPHVHGNCAQCGKGWVKIA